jgi:5-methylcytosine-specific restriction endonuclease McrA
MTNRDLTTKRAEVFGDVEPGTQCRICGRNVEDGRRKVCSDYCNRLQGAVMGLLNWSSLRKKIIARDDETCQICGYDLTRERRARRHIHDRIKEVAGERPEGPSALALAEGNADVDPKTHHERLQEWRQRRKEAKRRYGNPYENARDLEVDHIVRIADGGHPFDPGNLQTLCSECHSEKTASENSEQSQTPTRGNLSKSLLEYIQGGQADV